MTQLKTQCETLLEEHEDDVETWYFSYQQKTSLEDFLCRDRVLKGKDVDCLNVKGELLEGVPKYREDL